MKNEDRFLIAAKNDYILVTLKGYISARDVINASKQLLVTAGYYPGKPVIWLTSAADLSDIDLDAIEKAVKEIDSIYEGLLIGHIALVSERFINTAIVGLFNEFYNKDEARVFESFQEAEEWILSFRDA